MTWLPAHAGPGWYWLACPVHPYHGGVLPEPIVLMAHVLDPKHMGKVRADAAPSVVDLHTDASFSPWLIAQLATACRWLKLDAPTFVQSAATGKLGWR